jgi:NitT/TauT family transport system substrate-binding protein
MHLFARGLAGAVALGLAFAAAPPARAADNVTLMLNWFPLADHSPFYLAKQRGHFKDEGIDLKIVRGFGSGDTAKAIDLKQAEFGISDAPTVLIAISKGADLKMIGMVYDKAANNAFFYKDAGIRTVKDLVGRKVATPPGDSHRFLWPALARVHGIDPEAITFVNVKPEGKQAIVASRNADAAFDLYTSFPIWEKALGKGNVGNLLFADHGVALYGHAYIAHDDTIRNNPELVRRFLRATYKGWRDAFKERAAAIDALMAEVPGVDKDAYLGNLDLVLDLAITERSREHGLGWILPERMQQTIDITAQGGQMDKPLKAAEVFTNDFNSKIEAPK